MVMKIVSMTPVRLGSKRIKNKNLRLLAGKPLVAHAIEKCKKAGIFDEIYINSESEIFKDIAEEYGVKFYKRNEYLASDKATNDEFVNDFIQNVPCDIVIQVNSTSPFTTAEDIKRFVKCMLDNDYDTLHGVKMVQIEGLYKDKPLNYNPMVKMPPSQTLTPTMHYCSAIMGWKSKKHLENMKKYGCATFGAKGKVGYFPLEGLATIDIDNEEDWQLAELAIKYRENPNASKYEYYQGKANERKETNVRDILIKDGVVKNDLDDTNKPVVNIVDIIATHKNNTSWSKRVINSESNSATLICQLPDEGNRRHYHADWCEWWYIISGHWLWKIGDKEYIVQKGDIVFIEKGKLHEVIAIGDAPAIRLAVSRDDVAHIYPEKEAINE